LAHCYVGEIVLEKPNAAFSGTCATSWLICWGWVGIGARLDFIKILIIYIN
jgi:hypothetical protein